MNRVLRIDVIQEGLVVRTLKLLKLYPSKHYVESSIDIVPIVVDTHLFMLILPPRILEARPTLMLDAPLPQARALLNADGPLFDRINTRIHLRIKELQHDQLQNAFSYLRAKQCCIDLVRFWWASRR